jgi:hypothetical protein
MDKEQDVDQPNFTKLAIATFLGVVILGAAVYIAYRYSQKQAGNVVLPGGVTYLGPSPTAAAAKQPPTAPLRFTAAANVSWTTQSGKVYPFSFSYPSTLSLVVFPGDLSDSIAIAWGNIPPQQNILFNMEFIDQRDESFLNQPKIEFVRNWYKFFSGLKGVESVQPFTNTNGMKGYKASYINYANTSPNVDVFFEIPGNSDLMLHMANGILDPTIFNRIIDTVKWTPTTPKANK